VTTQDPVADRQGTLAGGAALSLLAQVAPLVSGMALSVVLARTLGPAGNGHYVLLATMLGISTLIASLGLSAGLTYEVSRGAWGLGAALWTTCRVSILLGAVAVLLAGGFVLATRDTVFDGVGTTVIVMALATAPLFVLSQLTSSLAQGDQAFGIYAALEVLHALAIFLVGAVLAIPFGLTGAVTGLIAASVVGSVAGVVLLHRRAQAPGAARSTAGDGAELRRAGRYGVLSWLSNILQQVNYRFDLFILGGFAGAREVGLYSVAVTVTTMAWVLPHALQQVLFPRTAAEAAQTQAGTMSEAERDAATARACRHSVLMLPLVGVAVAALLAVAVPLLYGTQFSDTLALGFIMLPGVLALGVGKVLASVIAGRGRPDYNLYVGLIGAPVTLGLYLALIPPLEAWGAALATCVSYLTTTVVIAFYYRRATGMGISRALVPRRDDLQDYRLALQDALRRRRAARASAG
jgi:O-antigen/teichoic acid export membrane protein